MHTNSLKLSIKTYATTLALGACLLPNFAFAQSLTTDEQKASYAVGVDIGQNIVGQGLQIDANALSLGIQDAINQRELKLSDEQMAEAIENLTAKMQQQQQAKMQAIADENAKQSADFFKQNASKSGIKTTDSGIQYKVEKDGSGKSLSEQKLDEATIQGASIKAHYRGTLLNGEEFDSSYTRGEPAQFPLNGVILGWQQIIPLMKTGAKWTVYIPAELAYGERGAYGVIGPNEALIFEIELLEVEL